ncbi:MAG: NAD(+)/NADH kinase [Synergistetes bacterium]|nr:NAD(+)/NADH kinase [Synergistota bacterium]MCX8127565.1 NAD(+)/NADH kinase [Synergistota bacterium]MDW8191518.1 NAD(+)/NADH kinase [Synergistota bacterium]
MSWLNDKGIRVFLTREGGVFLKREELALDDYEFAKAVKVALIVGGDGTFLKAARLLAPYGVLMLGINVGRLGFLVSESVSTLEIALSKVLEGKFEIDERMMLEASFKGEVFYALNEFVIMKGAFARLINLRVFIDEEYFASYPADGLIISTPTGSTAYSLSAGGPILHPALPGMVLTPICAHTFYARPIIIPLQSSVRIIVEADHEDIMLTQDGQIGFRVLPGDEVFIKKAPFFARMITFKGRSFFELLRKKLKLGVVPGD